MNNENSNYKTIFSPLPQDVEIKFSSVGFDYLDKTYINVFRWMWNHHHIHPNITSFSGDPSNKTRVVLMSIIAKDSDVYYCEGYDEAVIWVVEYISKNLDKFFEMEKNNEQYY